MTQYALTHPWLFFLLVAWCVPWIALGLPAFVSVRVANTKQTTNKTGMDKLKAKVEEKL